MDVTGYLKDNGITDVKCLGYVSNKTLSKVFRRYKYIEVCDFWYDSKDDPNVMNWIDVEGIGYGWIWLSYDKERSNKKLRNYLYNFAKRGHHKEAIYHKKENNIETYWWSLSDEIVQVRLSNNELDFFK